MSKQTVISNYFDVVLQPEETGDSQSTLQMAPPFPSSDEPTSFPYEHQLTIEESFELHAWHNKEDTGIEEQLDCTQEECDQTVHSKNKGRLGVSGSDAQLHGLEHKTAGRTVAVLKDPEEDRGSGTHDHIPFASASGAASSGDPITVPPSPPGDADSNDGWWPWVHRRCRKSMGICYRADVPPRCCAKLPRGKTQ